VSCCYLSNNRPVFFFVIGYREKLYMRDRKEGILKIHFGMQRNAIIKFEVHHKMLSLSGLALTSPSSQV